MTGGQVSAQKLSIVFLHCQFVYQLNNQRPIVDGRDMIKQRSANLGTCSEVTVFAGILSNILLVRNKTRRVIM